MVYMIVRVNTHLNPVKTCKLTVVRKVTKMARNDMILINLATR